MHRVTCKRSLSFLCMLLKELQYLLFSCSKTYVAVAARCCKSRASMMFSLLKSNPVISKSTHTSRSSIFGILAGVDMPANNNDEPKCFYVLAILQSVGNSRAFLNCLS